MRTSSKKSKLSPEAKVTLKSIFLVLFIDLVGFSIIFPLFPRMLEYYVLKESTSGLMGTLIQFIHKIQLSLGDNPQIAKTVRIVFFGGILGSIYSLLQFLFAPLWGTLSDKFGRKPILVISLSGIVLSYVAWIFAGQFWILVLSRILSGVMGGNISTATAAISDQTDENTRSQGMAIIGVAFGLGFLVGPAMGGFLSMIDLTAIFPNSTYLGINPFSMPALFALLLSIINLVYVVRFFKETLPRSVRGTNQKNNVRILNPFRIFETKDFPGVFLTIFSYFVFLSIFSGMEFTLTFLTLERLNFDPKDNGYMFIYIGLVLAIVQGGFVRRYAHQIGEKKMSLMGVFLISPALFILGISYNTISLYVALFLLAVGAALVTPCLTSLVSLYTPATAQGRVLGIFRSMGALARAIGPLLASVIYWRLGPQYSYWIGGIFLIIPFFLGIKLPKVPKRIGVVGVEA